MLSFKNIGTEPRNRHSLSTFLSSKAVYTACCKFSRKSNRMHSSGNCSVNAKNTYFAQVRASQYCWHLCPFVRDTGCHVNVCVLRCLTTPIDAYHSDSDQHQQRQTNQCSNNRHDDWLKAVQRPRMMCVVPRRVMHWQHHNWRCRNWRLNSVENRVNFSVAAVVWTYTGTSQQTVGQRSLKHANKQNSVSNCNTLTS